MIELLKGTVTPKDWASVGVIIGITGLLCVGFYFLVYEKQLETLEALRSQDEQLVADLEVAREKQANIEDLRREYDKYEQLVTRFEQRLPETREIPQLMTQFEAIADSVGLDVDVSKNASTVDPNKETIPFSVTAYGDFHQIATFINQLERHERYLKVSDLHIESEEAFVSRATFTLSTYRFIQSSGQGPVPREEGGGAQVARSDS